MSLCSLSLYLSLFLNCSPKVSFNIASHSSHITHLHILPPSFFVSHTTLRSVVQGMWLESGACARRRGRRRQLLGGSGAEEQEQEQQEEGVRSRGSSVRPGTPGGVTLANRRAGFSRYACFSDSISLCSTSAWHLVIHDHCPQFWALLTVAQACTKLFTVRTILAETREALKWVWSCRGSSLGTLVQHDSGDQSGFGWGVLGLGRTLRSNSIDTFSTRLCSCLFWQVAIGSSAQSRGSDSGVTCMKPCIITRHTRGMP